MIDRGPHPIKVLHKLMEMPNAVCLVGNHELMALDCLKFLMKEITLESIGGLNMEMIGNLSTWAYNGSDTTIAEFRELSHEEQLEIIDFLRDALMYEELEVGGKEYLLVHAGLGNYSPEKEIEDYSLKEIVWDRADYEVMYFPDRYVITGHTPTQVIEGNPRPGYIFRKNNHIAIDCGAFSSEGRLAAICLDTDEEFYAEKVKQ